MQIITRQSTESMGLVEESAIDKDVDGRRANSKMTLTHVKKNVRLFSHFVLNLGGNS